MRKKVLLIIPAFFLTVVLCNAQAFIKTSDLFGKPEKHKGGELLIVQDPAVDTLFTRFIVGNKQFKGGIEGYRIQIYRSSARNAREESGKVRAGFITSFPDIPSYAEYAEPGYFIVKVGDFRSKMEAAKVLNAIRKKFPNAYSVPSIIYIPGQERK